MKLTATVTNNKTDTGIFRYLFLLTCFLVLIEVSFFILCNKAYLSDFTFVSDKIKIPAAILPGILFFIAAQIAIHFTYCLITWFSATFSSYLLRLSPKSTFNLAISLWLSGIGAAFAANQYYFPNSKFTELTSLVLFSHTSAAITAGILTIFYVTMMVISAIAFLVWLTEKSVNLAVVVLLICATVTWAAFSKTTYPPPTFAGASKPNVIIIGVDSLRPDFLGYFGAEHPTPFLDAMLNQATVFTEAITPLARTFPSWTSVLTGEHPRELGIRFNLADTTDINLTKTIPFIFRQHGYETIYATDETRFSNIDHHFGFDTIITPPMGLNDFLLGTFNDFPMSNLLINTALGRWLFPYSYANRPVFATYNPDSFIELMRPSIMQSRSHPVMMAVHFCLPHYPYLWAELSGIQYSPQERYRESIRRIDKQLQDFFQLLAEARLLDKAIVVLLSDHGEALELSGDRITLRDNYMSTDSLTAEPPHFYPPSLDEEQIDQSAGHGTDVLGLSQYHTLLAFKLFGLSKQHTGDITGVVPLTDIKQTLLSLAGITTGTTPITEIIQNKVTSLPSRHIFIESDYSPAAMRTVYPETRKVMLEGIQLFQINPVSTRLTVKPRMGEMIIRSKQVADIYENWMLALYPQEASDYIPVLVNLKTGQWTDNLDSKFALQSPAMVMLKAINQFYFPDSRLQGRANSRQLQLLPTI